jgi:hypothetical protein
MSTFTAKGPGVTNARLFARRKVADLGAFGSTVLCSLHTGDEFLNDPAFAFPEGYQHVSFRITSITRSLRRLLL